MQKSLACVMAVVALQGAAILDARAQTDPNAQLRDLGLPPAVTPNLPPALNPNLPPPSGKRYMPGASGPFVDPDRGSQVVPAPQGDLRSGGWLRGEIRSGGKMAQAPNEPGVKLNRIADIVPYLRRCWNVPAGIQQQKIDATVRMSLSRDGNIIGTPRITYVNKAATAEQREILLKSMARALRVCAPFPLSAALGNAVAGRIFAIRFVVEPNSTSL